MRSIFKACLALVAVGNQIYVIGRGPEPNITVSATNQIFHVGTDDQEMMIGSKLINMKEMIFVFVIFDHDLNNTDSRAKLIRS
jgi:hypothetical protein